MQSLEHTRPTEYLTDKVVSCCVETLFGTVYVLYVTTIRDAVHANYDQCERCTLMFSTIECF